MLKAMDHAAAPPRFAPNSSPYRRRYSGLATLLGLLLTLATHQASASDHDVPAANYLHPQTLVEVEPGRRLNLLCMGQGSPTVLLDSGLGDSSLTWRKVQAALAQRTRVCAFDRAGYGFSDEATRPSTAQAAVDDMVALIDRASLGPQVVLVAHSLGGEQALLFALEKPDAIAGMVLVDPAYPGQPQTGDEVEQLANNRSCLRAAQANLLAHSVPDSLKHCLDSPPNSDAALHAELNRQWSRVQNNAARLSEAENLHIRDDHGHSENDRELLKHWHGLHAMPLIVLSAGTVWPSTPSLTSAEARAKWSEHIKGHQRLAALSSQGKDIVVPGTTHYIQQIKPWVVIEAVDELMEQIKKGAGPAASGS